MSIGLRRFSWRIRVTSEFEAPVWVDKFDDIELVVLPIVCWLPGMGVVVVPAPVRPASFFFLSLKYEIC
jgi:hypothetical protein